MIVWLFVLYASGVSISDYLLPNENTEIIMEIINYKNQDCLLYFINKTPSIVFCGNSEINSTKELYEISLEYANLIKKKINYTELIDRLNQSLINYNLSRTDDTNPRNIYMGLKEEFACRRILGEGIIPINVKPCDKDPMHCYTTYICRSSGGLDCDTRLFNAIKPLVTNIFNSSYIIDIQINNAFKIINNLKIENYKESLQNLQNIIILLNNTSTSLRNNKLRLEPGCGDCYGVCPTIIHNVSELNVAFNITKTLLNVSVLVNFDGFVETLINNSKYRRMIKEQNIIIKNNFYNYSLAINNSEKLEKIYLNLSKYVKSKNLTEKYNKTKNVSNLLQVLYNTRNVTDFRFYISTLEIYNKDFENEINLSLEKFKNLEEKKTNLMGWYFLNILTRDLDAKTKNSYETLLYNLSYPYNLDVYEELLNKTINLTEELSLSYVNITDINSSLLFDVYKVYSFLRSIDDTYKIGILESTSSTRILLASLVAYFIASAAFIILYLIKIFLTSKKALVFLIIGFIILILGIGVYGYSNIINKSNEYIYSIYINSPDVAIIYQDGYLEQCVKNFNRTIYVNKDGKCISKNQEINCKDITGLKLLFFETNKPSKAFVYSEPINEIHIYLNRDDVKYCSALASVLK
jgi:thiol-disulfide isomerase/thioredoxin